MLTWKDTIMRNLFAPGALAFVSACVLAPAMAQPPANYETIYDEPTDVNLGGRPVVADIALHADMDAAREGKLRLVLTTDVTKFITETERDLENWIAARHDECGERWKAGEPLIDFPAGAIRFALDLEIEYWTCGWNGKAKPGRKAHEAGSIDVTLIPYVAGGKLQTRLDKFAIEDRRGVSKYLPLEFIIRRAIDQELIKLNNNPKFYRAPKPLYGEGFRYQSISGDKGPDGRVVITARYRASGSVEKLDRVVEQVRAEGISQ